MAEGEHAHLGAQRLEDDREGRRRCELLAVAIHGAIGKDGAEGNARGRADRRQPPSDRPADLHGGRLRALGATRSGKPTTHVPARRLLATARDALLGRVWRTHRGGRWRRVVGIHGHDAVAVARQTSL